MYDDYYFYVMLRYWLKAYGDRELLLVKRLVKRGFPVDFVVSFVS
jgi:hypothetical protein